MGCCVLIGSAPTGSRGARADGAGGRADETCASHASAPWQRLYFLPEPHGQGSFRPTAVASVRRCTTGVALDAPPERACVNVVLAPAAAASRADAASCS